MDMTQRETFASIITSEIKKTEDIQRVLIDEVISSIFYDDIDEVEIEKIYNTSKQGINLISISCLKEKYCLFDEYKDYDTTELDNIFRVKYKERKEFIEKVLLQKSQTIKALLKQE